MWSMRDQFYYVLLPPCLFFIFLLIKWLSTIRNPRKNLPPSPPKLPIIGNLHQLGIFPHRSLHSLALKHGPLMLLHLGSVPVLIVSSAEAAQEILKTNDLAFSNRPKSTIARKILYNYKDIAFAPYGEYWRQIRSICVLELLSSKRVQSFRAVREEETALLIDKIKQSCCADSSSVVNLSEILAEHTNNIVCSVALGRKYSGDVAGGQSFKELLGELVELLGVFNVGDYIPWLGWIGHLNGWYGRADKVAKVLDTFLDLVVQEHAEGSERYRGLKIEGDSRLDFVDILLQIQRAGVVGFPLHNDTIKALILDVFAAGTDTTYTALEWIMTELLRNPKSMQILKKEVREAGKGKQGVTELDIEKIPYLKVVIKETLRLHPPLPLLVPRESTQNVKVMGHDIAVGTQVYINAWTIGRDPLIWDEAEEFKPERFLDCSTDFKGNHFEFIPFGAGRRGCPGLQFATAVDELALANLVFRFDFALPGGAREDELDLSESAGMTVHKKMPLLAIVSLASV
ncbi:cytochrome P450 736A117-like [Diospyros lotus]|uniref:cytochrome P450 736A117-like n=1 Tax=Diospyros lotus TaxID=55363 RepID=UPI0022532A71|nr:cytochrome P450 736A117-like [Diospyros lotus]